MRAAQHAVLRQRLRMLCSSTQPVCSSSNASGPPFLSETPSPCPGFCVCILHSLQLLLSLQKFGDVDEEKAAAILQAFSQLLHRQFHHTCCSTQQGCPCSLRWPRFAHARHLHEPARHEIWKCMHMLDALGHRLSAHEAITQRQILRRCYA